MVAPPSAPAAAPANPRAVLLASLAAGLQGALAAGDVAAAQVVHEAIGKLLAAAPASDVAAVVDLGRERERRRPG